LDDVILVTFLHIAGNRFIIDHNRCLEDVDISKRVDNSQYLCFDRQLFINLRLYLAENTLALWFLFDRASSIR